VIDSSESRYSFFKRLLVCWSSALRSPWDPNPLSTDNVVLSMQRILFDSVENFASL